MPRPGMVDRPMAVPLFGKLNPFWALQVFGWSAYFLVHMLVLANQGTWNARTLYGYATATAAGFSVTLLMRLVYRRSARTGPGPGWILVLVVGSILGANAIMIAADVPKLLFWPAGEVFPALSVLSYLQRFYWWFLYCIAWSVLYLGYQFWKARKAREQEAAAAFAQAEAAQIQMLRYALNPDLLFKALFAIRDLIAHDGRQARLALTELSEYLRYSLVSREHTKVPLGDEMGAIRHFLAVRGSIADTPLQTAIDVNPDAEECAVTPFTVLPLVEKAVEEGLSNGKTPLRIHVAARLCSHGLRIEVGDSVGKPAVVEIARD
jgi:two-component system LytT family sensor kinase